MDRDDTAGFEMDGEDEAISDLQAYFELFIDSEPDPGVDPAALQHRIHEIVRRSEMGGTQQPLDLSSEVEVEQCLADARDLLTEFVAATSIRGQLLPLLEEMGDSKLARALGALVEDPTSGLGEQELHVPSFIQDVADNAAREQIEHEAFTMLCRRDVCRTVPLGLRKIINLASGFAEHAVDQRFNPRFDSLWNAYRSMFVVLDVHYHLSAVRLGKLGRIPAEYAGYLLKRLNTMETGIQTLLDMRDVVKEHQAIVESVGHGDTLGVRMAIKRHLAMAQLRWRGDGQFQYDVTVRPVSAAYHSFHVVRAANRTNLSRNILRRVDELPEALWDDETMNPEMYGYGK